MKKLLLIGLVCLMMDIDLQAQKKIEQSFPVSASQLLFLNLKFASQANIQYWDKAEVKISVSVNINQNQNNDNFELISQNNPNELSITGQIKDLKSIAYQTDTNQNTYSQHYSNYGYWDEEGKVFVRTGKEISADIFYDIFVPRNTSLKIKTIGGNLKIAYQSGKLQAKTIGGNIDLAISESQKASFKFKTYSGDIFTDLKIEFPPQAKEELKRIGGGSFKNEIAGALNGGGDEIRLESVSGDLLVRKK